jgi:hypothetical protein
MKGQAVHCATVEVVHKGVFLNTYTAIVWATLGQDGCYGENWSRCR